MRIALHPGVHVSFDKERAVLLDLPRDRYLSIAAPEADGAEEPLARIAAPLIEAGLAQALNAPLGVDAVAAIAREGPLLRPRHVTPFLAACIWARSAVASRRIELALAELSVLAARRPARIVDETEVRRIQERYERLRPFFPGARVCLFDTLAMSRFALSQGVRLTLVFGVRVQPFSAHCWAEWRSIILNDRYGHAHAYQPILRAGA